MVQALIASAMASLVSLGIVQMIQSAHDQQRRTQILSTLTEMKSRIETIMRDQQSFGNTMNGNSTEPFISLKAGNGNVNVAAIGLANPQKFWLFDSSNWTTSDYKLLGPGDAAGPYNGFTERGVPCATFYPTLGSGNDACPISYRLLIGATCPAASPTSCRNPQLKLVARLVFNPSNATNSSLNKLRSLIFQIPDGRIS